MHTIRTRKPSVAFQLIAAFSSLLLFPALTRAETGKKEAWQILETAIRADAPDDRATAIRVLGLLPGDPKAVELAGKGLDDPKSQVRAAAAAALGQMGASAAIPSLKKALYDGEVSVALAAAHALNLMHDESAYEVYYGILTGGRKGGKGLIGAQLDTLQDPKKLAGIGLRERQKLAGARRCPGSTRKTQRSQLAEQNRSFHVGFEEGSALHRSCGRAPPARRAGGTRGQVARTCFPPEITRRPGFPPSSGESLRSVIWTPRPDRRKHHARV